MIRKKNISLWFVCLLMFSRFLWADHLPSSEIAQGKPEHVIAGVNVYDDRIEQVIKRLGKPNKITNSTTPDYPSGSGERSYEWTRDGIRLRVGTEFYTDKDSNRVVESAPMIVDLWGEHGNQLGRTASGLALGAGLSAIRKIYGQRFHKGPHDVTIQWKDETTLVVDLNSAGRIVHMQLLAATE